MSLINRIRVLWYLSGLEFHQTVEDAEDTMLANEIKREAKFHRERLKKKQPATIVQDDPPEFFPIAEEEHDTTSKQSLVD
jgi:hypothetical protein